MPLQGRSLNKSCLGFVFAAILAAGALSFVLVVKRLLLGSLAPTDIIPSGTVLVIRLTHPLTSQTARLDDRFQARLQAVKGAVVIPSGLWVEGECLAARRAILGVRGGYLRLALSALRDRHGHRLPLQTTTLSQWGNRVLGVDGSLGTALKAGSQDPQLDPMPEGESGEAVVRPEAELSFVLLEPLLLTGHRSHL